MPDDTPRSYPSWRFWEDGRTTIVQSPAELAALPPGHAGSPVGPFPTVGRWGAPEMGRTGEHEPLAPPPDLPTSPPPETSEELTDTEALKAQARALQQAGHTLAEIARAVQRSPRTVGRWLEDA